LIIKGSWFTPAARFSAILVVAVLTVILAVGLAVDVPHWNQTFGEGDLLSTPDARLRLEALDLTPEPGEISRDDELQRFYQRQQQLSGLLADPNLTLRKADSQESQHLQMLSINFTGLSLLFWVQVLVGVGAVIIAGWVWALRHRSQASCWFVLSGLATLLFTVSAAVYTTRDLALPATLFRSLVGVNVFGASLFGIAMIALFLCYPLKVKRWRRLTLIQALVFAIWTGLSLVGYVPAWAGVNLITLVEMVVIVFALVAQFVATRNNPAARAALSWLGLSVLAGAGAFILLNALPMVLGSDATMDQGVAFVFFLVIYFGLAAGITRYRLFDVGKWAFTFLFYSLGTVLLILLDAALILLIGLDRLPALGLSFFITGLLYLPMRDGLQRFFRRAPDVKPHELLDLAMQVALAPGQAERRANWEALVQRLFEPLERIPLDQRILEQNAVITNGALINASFTNVTIADDGMTLLLPEVAGAPAMQLKYPASGKSLFSREAQQLAQQLVTLVERALSSRQAYEKGVKEERLRIAQDLHDDVGARLLNGLHADETRLRAIILESMADIRGIVRGIAGETVLLVDTLADLRAESIVRTDAAGIDLIWPIEGYDTSTQRIDYHLHKTLRSLCREAVSNAIRHAEANRLAVDISLVGNGIQIELQDNGKGYPDRVLKGEEGFGLKGIRARVKNVGGTVQMENTQDGARILLSLENNPAVFLE
jgi:signal transduction histidine kinase